MEALSRPQTRTESPQFFPSMKPTLSSVRRSLTAPANFVVKNYRTLAQPFRLSWCAMLLFLP